MKSPRNPFTEKRQLKHKIYLDNQATTAVDKRVLEVMMPYFTEHYGNPASRNHYFGWVANEAVEIAREQIADMINSSSSEIVFTSGATESNNLALRGIARMYGDQGHHIITVTTEHKAVLDTCADLARQGSSVTHLSVDSEGMLDPEKVRKAITGKTVLVSVMHANNEIGVIQPIADIGRICHENNVVFHVDAAQSVGKIPVDVQSMHIDLLSISAHKIYGPKGIGALFIRRRDPRVKIQPQITGGGHQNGIRSGTLPVPLIVGLGEACNIATAEMEDEGKKILKLRQKLLDGISAEIQNILLNGHAKLRLPGNLNLCFRGAEGEALIMGMTDIAVSAGSACTSSTIAPSYVLKAIGRTNEQAYSAIRFGIGRFNTTEEIDITINTVVKTVKRIINLNRK